MEIIANRKNYLELWKFAYGKIISYSILFALWIYRFFVKYNF